MMIRISKELIASVSILLLGLMGCTHKLEVQEGAPFEVSHMPYHSNIGVRETTEIRMTLSSEDSFEGTKYTVRYFPFQGEGYLRIGGDGEALRPNDRYNIKAGDFRMYYTPIVEGAHQLEVVFENNHGQSYTVNFTLNVSADGSNNNAGSLPNNKTRTEEGMELGTPYLGEDGYWYINGENSGVDSNIDPSVFDPTVEIIDGSWYINGEKTKLSANEGDVADITIGENGNWHINGEDTWVKAPGIKKPIVGIDGNGEYTLDGRSTGITAIVSEPLVSTKEYIINNTVEVDQNTLPKGSYTVSLVSKQGTSQVKVLNESGGYETEEKEYTGLVLSDGNAIFRVFDTHGNPVPNAIVRNMPKLTGKSYQADADGYLIVPNQDLLYEGSLEPASVNVSVNGKNFQSSKTTIVPNRVRIGIELAYNVEGDYFFKFTQKQGNQETGEVELPIEVPMDEFLKKGNYCVYLEGHKTTVTRVRKIYHGIPENLIEVSPSSAKLSFIEAFRFQPSGNRKVPFYAVFNCLKGPFGEKVEGAVFLGFGRSNPLSGTTGWSDILAI